MSLKNGFYEFDGANLTLNVLATPNAKNDKILSIKGEELKISIKAQREKSKATAYLTNFLMQEFGTKDVAINFGEFSTHKQFIIKNPTKIPPILGVQI